MKRLVVSILFAVVLVVSSACTMIAHCDTAVWYDPTQITFGAVCYP